MLGTIRIEIYPLGLTRVSLAQPRNAEAAERLWGLYRALRPEIDALEVAARRAAARPPVDDTGDRA